METFPSRPSNSLEDYLLRKSEPTSYDRKYQDLPDSKKNEETLDLEEESDDLYAYKTYKRMKDNIKEIKHRLKTKTAHRLYIVHTKLSKLRTFAILVYMIIPFFQKPPWCIPQEYSSDCSVNTKYNLHLITTSYFYINNSLFVTIEIILMIFITGNMCMKFFFLENSKTRNIRVLFYIIATIVTLITDITCVMEDLPLEVDLLIKPFFLLFYNRTVRAAFVHYMKILYSTFSVLLLIFFNIFVFAALGKIIFFRTDEEYLVMTTYWEAVYELFALQTTANFPDLMLPVYEDSRSYSIFFVIFLAFNLLILVNMLIAVFYLNYKRIYDEERGKSLIFDDPVLRDIFNKHLHMPRFDRSVLKRDLEEYEGLKHGPSNLLESFKETFHRNTNLNRRTRYSNKKKQQHDHFSFRGKSYNFISNDIVQIVVSMLNGLAFILCAMSFEHGNVNTFIYNYFVTGLHCLFLLLCFLEIYVLRRRFLKKVFNIFEISTISSFIIMRIFMGIFPEAISYKILNFFVIPRILRFTQVLMKFSSIRLVIKAIYRLLPLCSDMFAVLVVIFYLFAAIGVHVFGGLFTYERIPDLEREGISRLYIYNNFNDFSSSIITLFELLIVSNWTSTAKAHSIIQGSTACRVFFVFFNVVAVLLALNVIIAFIIDYLITQWEKKFLEYKTILYKNNDNMESDISIDNIFKSSTNRQESTLSGTKGRSLFQKAQQHITKRYPNIDEEEEKDDSQEHNKKEKRGNETEKAEFVITEKPEQKE